MATFTNDMQASIGLVLLAAGGSSRLGHPKQLLKIEGQTLLQHSIAVALASEATPVVLVLGANAGLIEKGIKADAAHVVLNQEWQEGMASSIRAGIKTLMRIKPAAAGAVVMLCDQPYVNTAIIDRLIAVHRESGKPLVSCMYANTVGTPTFFHKSLFEELLQLQGDVGAKSLLLKHAEDLEIISFPEGQLDIDTAEDYKRIKEEGKAG